MTSDIRQDLAKYVELYPAQSTKSPNIFKVLLHSPGYYVITSYRLLYWMKARQEKSGSQITKLLYIGLRKIASGFWKIGMKIAISDWPEIGPGLYLSNKGGIIMGPKRIGSGCVINHNVTIGMDLNREHPEIGNNVWIGSNSLIYGKIIKDGVIVQPDTVVGKNVPACAVIKGNPGKIVHRNIDNSSFLTNNSPYLEYE